MTHSGVPEAVARAAALLCIIGIMTCCATVIWIAVPVPASHGARPVPMQHGVVVGGTLGTGETWGPGLITVTADLLIERGVVVTIVPGTTVQMASADGANLGVDAARIEIIVLGTLDIDGPVILTSQASSSSCGDWYGLRFAPGSSGQLHAALIEKAVHAVEINSTTRITLTDCTLRYSCHKPSSGDAWGAGLTILAGTHHIANTQIYGNRLLATSPKAQATGAGVWLAGGSTRFDRSAVYENSAQSAAGDARGGGVALWGGGQPIVHNCDIHHNEVKASGRASGAGIYIDNADASIQAGTSIRDNSAIAEDGPAYGGGIAITAMERVPMISIVDSRITGNLCSAQSTAGCFGAGIGFASDLWPAELNRRYGDEPPSRLGYRQSEPSSLGPGASVLELQHALVGQTRAVLSHNLIADNTNLGLSAHGGGIGMEAGTSAARFDANLIRGNVARADSGPACGGGACLASRNGVHLSNNLVVNNEATALDGWPADGGGIYADGPESHVVNNTIVNNAANDGSGVYLGNGTLYNNIVTSNRAEQDGGGVVLMGGSAGSNDVWSNIPNNYAPGGLGPPQTDIDADPSFVASGDLVSSYHLKRTSPCVDAASADGPGIPSHDFDQHPRPQGVTWDMGFDEVLGLEVVKSASATEITSGSLLSYTVAITNWSTTTAAEGLWIRDRLPPRLRWHSGPDCSRPTCGHSSATVWWQGDLPASTGVTLVYTGMVEPGATITNVALYSAEIDLTPIRGQSNVVATTVQSPILTVYKYTEGVGEPVAGAPLTYTAVVANASPWVSASGVLISDALPTGTSWVSGGDHHHGIVTLAIPEVPPEGQAQASWQVSSCQTILNNQRYRVITSTQLVDSSWGPLLITSLRPPDIEPNFDQSSDDLIAGATVTFTDRSKFNGAPIKAWGWDFGDGSRGNGTPVTHTFNSVASYTVTMTITDRCGYTESLAVKDAVSVWPPPLCTAISGVDLSRVAPGAALTDEPVQFSADISPDNAQKRYSFRLIVDGTLGFRLTSGRDPLTFSQKFGRPGTHRVEIEVWNCKMSEGDAITDVVELSVDWRPSIYLPMVEKG